MELFPAIDLRGGAAVRLAQGDFDREVGYGDPLVLAASFAAAGAPWVHVVDLSAARTGVPHERATLSRIVDIVGIGAGTARVQTGGGIRRAEDVEAVLALGVDRVVLGTAALEDPGFATTCARRWPGRVAVGLDYVVGADGVARALGHGWAEGSGSEPSVGHLLSHWNDEPVAAVVATSIARDGMLEGPDLSGLGTLLESTALPVVASGGVAGLDDLRALAALVVDGRGLAGVIVGKALVEGRFSVEEALAACVPSA
jgi:phosphoribosylformimino-5-aminoimidazole carboxamide ribotide isomerase